MSDEDTQTSPVIILPDNIQQPQKSSSGRPKSFVWGTYIKQGNKVLEGHYEATCLYCNSFWNKGSLESHLANNCLKVPLEVKQIFLNRLTTRAETSASNQKSKKRKLDDEAAEQTKIMKAQSSLQKKAVR